MIQVVAFHKGMGWHAKGAPTDDWGLIRAHLAACSHDMMLTNWGFLTGERPEDTLYQLGVMQHNGIVYGYAKDYALFQATRGSTPPPDENGPGGDRDKPYTYHMPHNAADLLQRCYHRKEAHHAVA